jgi:hypothetical protein
MLGARVEVAACDWMPNGEEAWGTVLTNMLTRMPVNCFFLHI